MAESPSHRFGQYLGNVLEALLLPELRAFCNGNNLYVDCKQDRPEVRTGQKVTWIDRYGNKHDLDFVIEKNGSATQQGRPLAFIEAAWRRYTKHSRNKAQEIQGAVLPIAEKYAWDKPFLGAVLAGVFTRGSLDQLRSVGFNIIYINYESIVRIYAKHGMNIAFDEKTADSTFAAALAQIDQKGLPFQTAIIAALRAEHRGEIDAFLDKLKAKIVRHIEQVVLIPLFGKEYDFDSVAEVVSFIRSHDPVNTDGTFRSYEIIVRYSNGDKVEASFASRSEAERFLEYAAG